jgi:hypothetical protein
MQAFVSFSALKNCQNPYDSYGEICVHCNACGRFDISTQNECKKRVMERQLEQYKNFDAWADEPDLRTLQARNMQKNIEYLENEIKKLDESRQMQGT